MTQQSLYPNIVAVRADVPRDERAFFEIVGPALANEPLTFLCGDREYRYGSGADPTVVRINDTDAFRRMLYGSEGRDRARHARGPVGLAGAGRGSEIHPRQSGEPAQARRRALAQSGARPLRQRAIGLRHRRRAVRELPR